MKKLPPIQKILEAYTAIVDNHVNLTENEAKVTSYAGYPVIAVLMLQGKLPFNQKLADNFKAVNWNEINLSFKRNYAKAATEVIEEKGLNENEVMAELEVVYENLKKLPITIKRGSLRPPKARK